MRIGIDALSVVPGETGGGETYLVELLRALSVLPEAAGRKIVVYASVNNAGLFPSSGPVHVEPLPLDNRSRPRRLLFEHLRLGPRLSRDGIDVLYAPGNALPLRCPVRTVLGIQSLHSFLVPEEMSRFRVAYFTRMVPRSAHRATRVLCVSEDIKKTLLEVVPGLDESKARVVYEGAPQDLHRVSDEEAADVAARSLTEPGKFVLFVSSLNRFKRPERAAQAVDWIRREKGESWRLVMAGRASYEDEQRVHASIPDFDQLAEMVGVVPRSGLAALLTGARAMVYPSTVETFGLPPLEAMALGCPVVAANCTSIPEITGDAAVLVDPDDVAAFGAALYGVLHDEELRATLIARGYERVKRFTWEAAARGTLSLLEEAAGT